MEERTEAARRLPVLCRVISTVMPKGRASMPSICRRRALVPMAMTSGSSLKVPIRFPEKARTRITPASMTDSDRIAVTRKAFRSLPYFRAPKLKALTG